LIRDELWEDRAGDRWRITEVRRIGRIGPASVTVRHVSGISAKVPPREMLEAWKRVQKDPLAGKRRDLQSGKLRVLVWPDSPEPPVSPGERFYLQGVRIDIERVERKIIKGRPAEWHATFSREEDEVKYLLRATPPSHADSQEDRELDAEGIHRAAVESAYTSSPVAAISGEPESVGPDWEDRGRAAREVQHQEARKAARDRERFDAELTRIQSRFRQEARERFNRGEDPDPLFAAVWHALLDAADRTG
jgi:hypothetical protein